MNTKKNDANNDRLRQMIEDAEMTQMEARAIFNLRLIKPYSISAWKAFLSAPGSARWRRFDDALLGHAEKTLAKHVKSP